MEMNTKNLMVSFVAIALVLSMVALVAADDLHINSVKVDDVRATDTIIDGDVDRENPVLIAGETVTVKVYFTSDVEDKDVTVKVTIDTGKEDIEAETNSFRVSEGGSYKKSLSIKIPYELKDELSDTAKLEVEIDGKNYEVEGTYELNVERVQYDADIKSVSTSQKVEAGETLPVDIVLKNVGFEDLDDLYVTVSISELGIEKLAYFGDIVALECDNSGHHHDDCDEDDEDTVSGRLSLEIPYDVTSGIFTLNVEVTNDDMVSTVVKQIVIENDFVDNVVVTSTSKTAGVNEEAKYSLLIVNPTDKVKVYRVVTESSGSLTSSTDEQVVAVSAGSSETVSIIAKADSEGKYNFDVNVFSGEDLVSEVTLSLNVEGREVTSPIVILTIILAIVFLVLLIILIVLIGKKPEKAEEFGESYY